MSQDGSSSRSYIKHPTEKARLDNLAFTSFPEDYLPYTSPSYQRKAPYLVWDDGGSRFRAKRRQLCRSCCCCGTVALASAIALLVAAILAIVAVSVYLGVVTNLFRSPILSISGRFRVMEGDDFEDSLLNLTSYEFITKAEYYKTLVENTFLSSSLEPAFIAARIYAFRPGSLLVFFRVHLDRRKLQQEDPETILMAKNLLIEEAIMAPKPSFDNLVLDLPSIDVREYGDEEWLMTYDFDAPPGDTNSLRQQLYRTKTSTESNKSIFHSSSTVSSQTPSTSSKLVPSTSSSPKNLEVTVSETVHSNRPASFASQTPKTPSIIKTSSKGEGSVHYGYAEWKPVELPDPISVASLGISPPLQEKKDRKTQPGRGSVSAITENVKPPIELRQPLSHPPKQSSQPSVSSIMSSVSLMILPNSKNKTLTIKENTGVGVVRAVLPDEEDSAFIPPSEELEKKARIDKNPLFSSSESKRMDLASFRLLDFDDHEDELPNANDTQSDKEKDVFVKELDLNGNASSNLSDLDFPEESIPETEAIGNVMSNRSFLPLEYTRSYDDYEKVLLEDESSTSDVFDGESEYTSGNDEKETLVSTYVKSHDVTTLLDDLEEKSIFVTRSPLLSQLLTDHGDTTEDALMMASGSGSSSEILGDESDHTNSISDFTTVKPPELNSSVAQTSPLTENITVNSIVTTVGSLMQTKKTSEISENLDDVVLSSFLEPSNISEENGAPSQNRHLTIVNHSSFHTEYHTLEKDLGSLFENSTSQSSENFENIKHEMISTDMPDIFVLEGSESSDLTTKEENDDLPTPLNSSPNVSNFSLPQILGFRKIARPFSDANFNRNDINDKNDFKDNIFYPIKSGFPSTISTEKTTTPFNQHNLELNSSQEGDNTIYGSSTLSSLLPITTNNSSVIGLGKNPIECPKGEVTCGSGECIPDDYQCNMRRDCKDNSDEKHCSCSEYLAVIGQSQKICDGVDDCWDRSDEGHCPWCSPGQFLCPQSRFCINMSQVCDGSNDCPFGTDERHCVKLANDEKSAVSMDYSSEGFLMVRKAGQWGKLCLDSLNDVALAESVRWKLDDLGKVVCAALTYREVEETTQVSDESNQQNTTFYEITDQRLKSSSIFNTSECRSKDVVRVKCQSLECGLRPLAMSSSRRRIVGGQSTGSGSWPWQVALYKEGEFQCGAVLVSDTWLISAGHCFFSTLTAYWTARMGILRRGTELPSPSEQVRRLVQIILHPDYVDKGFINDIALLRLEKPVPFSDYLRPLCLPLATEDVGLWHGQHCSVVGWGKLYEIGHIFPDSLQEVRLPVISTEECRKRIVFLSMYHITENMFCAGFERGGRDACLGDSGGPLMCQRQDGRWVLLGVTSNGDGCGRPGRPGVYTKVTKYLDWIYNVMQEDSFSNISDDKCLGHRCPLGRCVLQHKVCDGRFDCADGSDEFQCTF